MTSEIAFRVCTVLSEFAACQELQKTVWGDSDREAVPTHIFVAASKTGGQILGAFAGDQLVGYLFSLVGCRDGQVYLHSHQAGVHPAYQNRGIGRRLKLMQREEAMARGIFRVEWTFDPLQIRNAYFNVVRLGAIARTYLPNVYGLTVSPLDRGLPTDRLLAEWSLTSTRVREVLAGQPPSAGTATRRIFVPATVPDQARQTTLRQQFQTLFAANYMVTNLELQPEGMQYVLEPAAAVADSIWPLAAA